MAAPATVTAFEDDVLGALSTIEDAVLRSVRYVVASVEPVTKLMANQREFATKLVELLPTKVETPAPKVWSTPKARAAYEVEAAVPTTKFHDTPDPYYPNTRSHR